MIVSVPDVGSRVVGIGVKVIVPETEINAATFNRPATGNNMRVRSTAAEKRRDFNSFTLAILLGIPVCQSTLVCTRLVC